MVIFSLIIKMLKLVWWFIIRVVYSVGFCSRMLGYVLEMFMYVRNIYLYEEYIWNIYKYLWNVIWFVGRGMFISIKLVWDIVVMSIEYFLFFNVFVLYILENTNCL